MMTEVKTFHFRRKRGSEYKEVLQQWVMDLENNTGIWKDVPIVHTDNDSDFEREKEKENEFKDEDNRH